MSKNPTKQPKVSVYEISIQLRVLDKTIVPQIVVDKEPVLLLAHVTVLRAGETKRGAKRWFAFQQQSGLPTKDAPWYGWVTENDWTLNQDQFEVVAWLPLETLPAKKQTEVKNSEWGLLAVVLMENRLRLRDVRLDISMTDEAHETMRAELGLPELIYMPELERAALIPLLEKREIYQVFL